MSQNKRSRVSKYNAHDESFVYDHTATYDSDDFKNLSVLKLQSIASTLNVRNVKKYKKEQLIPQRFNKHEELRNLSLNNNEPNGKEEHKDSLVISSSRSDTFTFTDQLEIKFRDIVHCKHNNDVWFQASSIASYLEYTSPKKAIYDHVNNDDKLYFRQISLQRLVKPGKNIHPDTLFINKKGVLQLIHRSRMPLATGKKQELEEVYVATTALYEEKGVYKIGKAENSKKRIRNLNTGRAPDDDMYLCYVAQCYNALKAEQIIHKKLDAYRIAPNREFFKHSLEKIKSVIDDTCAETLSHVQLSMFK